MTPGNKPRRVPGNTIPYYLHDIKTPWPDSKMLYNILKYHDDQLKNL